MKILKFLLAGVIALGLMACNNEDVPDMTGEKDATISIKVFPSSDGPTLRAVGNLTAPGIDSTGLPAESAIKSLEVWVFVGGILETYQTATIAINAVPEVVDIPVTTGPRTVVVVANASLETQPTLTALQAKTAELTQDVTNGLVMTSDATELTIVSGHNYYGYSADEFNAKTPKITDAVKTSLGSTPMALTRVNARVAIVEATLDYTNVPADQKLVFDNLKKVEVAMFNVPKVTNLFGTSLAINADYLFGAKWPSPDLTYVGANVEEAVATTTLANTIDEAEKLIIKTNAPYYYVNESNGNDKMFIVLRAQVHLGDDPVTNLKGLYTDDEGYTYYPVWVNAINDKYTYTGDHAPDGNIYRNTQYNIYLTITGLGNPTIDPADQAWLDVKVQVEDWIVVGQNVTW